MTCLLGIDNGLTVSKAVLFDISGAQLAVARRRIPQSIPRARHIERDMGELWSATAEAIAEVIATANRPASDIAAVAATAHGDGIYLLDADRQPLGPGILSLDSRAGQLVGEWAQTDLFDEALALTGQVPHASAPSALLAWIKAHEPERFARIAHILASKDWLRFCLTGSIATDRTEASISFTGVRTQGYAPDALKLYGLEALTDALPSMLHSAEVAGTVTEGAAAQTGLVAGTPVATGLHDVTASALGIGAHRRGVVGIVAGTYSINEVVSNAPRTDRDWFCRNAIEPGAWNNMAISPASTANYDWFLDTLCAAELEKTTAEGASIHEALGREIGEALGRSSTLLFHPYLFGSPHGADASGSFIGLHGWHDRGDMLKAVLEGIAFNHRTHIDALKRGFDFETARLTGGGSRNPAFAQMFADVLGMPVTVTPTEEAAAWGAALCAGAAIGIYQGANADPRDLAALDTTYQPDPQRSKAYEERFAVHGRIVEALKPHWPAVEALAAANTGSR